MNKSKAIVSIVIPCFNASNFIEETIKSVLNQTYSHWEMLVVDDCSTDGSSSIIKQFESIDGRIKYLKTDKNTGSPAIPRNIGIEQSQGQYIALLDSDDVWFETKLEDQLKFMQEKPCRISYTDGVMMDEQGRVIRSMRKADWVNYRRTLKRNELSCSSVVFEKSLIGDLKFQNKPKEDFIFWIQLMKQTKEVAYNTHKKHYAYRLVGDSRSRNKGVIIRQQWQVLREDANLNVIDAAYCFMCWVVRNIIKYYLR